MLMTSALNYLKALNIEAEHDFEGDLLEYIEYNGSMKQLIYISAKMSMMSRKAYDALR